ncbi:MAG: hypothetical protein JNL90_12625 [Planctomycetes bacterium]|nr:hypothetical protein [Planctomycetota bacterium]
MSPAPAPGNGPNANTDANTRPENGPPIAPELLPVVESWPSLPEAIRLAILALVKASPRG